MKNIFNIKSYLVFLMRNKLYAAITIFGFAAALMFVILMTFYTRDQFTVDAQHVNGDRIFRMQYDGNERGDTPPALGEDLKSRYPEIEALTLYCSWNVLVKNDQGVKMSTSAIMVDSSFFSIFTFPFVEGTLQSALPTDDFVVLSESFARKMFGDRSAVGQTFKIVTLGDKLVTVGAVMKNIKNSTIADCDIVVRKGIRRSEWRGWVDGYNACNYITYVMLKPGADLNDKADDILKYFKEDLKFWLFVDDYCKSVNFVPLRDTYFNPAACGSGIRRGSLQFVLLLIAAAAVILIFAVINYVNLSVAQSGFRAKEMATRRLLGATTGEIFGRFIFESIFICFISFAIGLFFAMVAEPFFNSVLQTNVNIAQELTVLNVSLGVGFVLLLGVISGLVPAFVITKFKPIDVVKGEFTYRTKKVYSKILITFQYLITIVLIGSTIVIEQQTAFMRNINLGYHTDGLYVVEGYIGKKAISSTRARLEAIPGVEAVSMMRYMPIYWANNNSFEYNDTQQSFSIMGGDSLWMDMMGIEVLERTGNISDTAYWINQTGLRNLGLQKVIDKVWVSEGYEYALKGVVKDFHFGNLTDPISSAFLKDGAKDAGYVMLKLSNPNAIEGIKPIFAELTEGNPFTGEWADDVIARWSEDVRRQGELIAYLTMIAIIISSLGMLAMATYFIRQRASEIAVRKVFGATKTEVLGQLMWQFLKLVLIGYVLAMPLVWYFCSNWLEGFAYRTNIDIWVYLVAGVVAFAVASVTVFWQAYRAMIVPPAFTLKK